MSKYIFHVYRQKKQELNQVHNEKMFKKEYEHVGASKACGFLKSLFGYELFCLKNHFRMPRKMNLSANPTNTWRPYMKYDFFLFIFYFILWLCINYKVLCMIL